MGYVYCGFIFLNMLYVAMRDIAIRTDAKYYSVGGYTIIFLVVGMMSTLFDVQKLFSFSHEIPDYMIITFLAFMVIVGFGMILGSMYIACVLRIIDFRSASTQATMFVISVECIMFIVTVSMQDTAQQLGLDQAELLREVVFLFIPSMTLCAIVCAWLIRRINNDVV